MEEKGKQRKRKGEMGGKGREGGRRKWRQNEDKVREFEKEEKRFKKGNEERGRGRNTTC